jgi:hypothetical protein
VLCSPAPAGKYRGFEVDYMDVVNIIISIALVVTVVALVTGIVSMGHGGEFDEKHSTRLMFLRVGAQGVVILLLLLALYFADN